MAASRPVDPEGSHSRKTTPARPQGQPQNRVPPDQVHPQTRIPTAQKNHTPYSVCPPMNSLMIDVGGIAAISSGESATI